MRPIVRKDMVVLNSSGNFNMRGRERESDRQRQTDRQAGRHTDTQREGERGGCLVQSKK